MKILNILFLIVVFINLNAHAGPGSTNVSYGSASWYGKPFQGHRMANGKPYSMYKMTCASKTIPLGTRIQVKNLKTNKKALLIVTDRGPYKKNRILDVSKIAAIKLGFLASGTAPVRITILEN